MNNALWILLLVCSFSAMGARIAVIDSGTDVEHTDLLPKVWMNAAEVADNGRDDDRNGYQDDIYGWNFAESNNQVIDRKYLGTFSNDPYKFFEIQGKLFLNQATAEEIKWLKSKTKDPVFLKEMQKFGNFVHGTHVAGITADGNDKAELISVKLIPTEVKPFFDGLKSDLTATEYKTADKDLRMKLLKKGLEALAKQQMLLLEEIAAYVGGHEADVANGSFGTGYNQAKMITDGAFKMIYRRAPSAAESDKVVRFFLDALIDAGKNMVAAAPKTLFVFAAGNDGMNNDKYPTSPTNIQADNVISVAATYKYNFIAPFSNYGIDKVDVAAPGMLIHSTIPGNEYLHVSGTSQAAPYVANIAAQIKDMNPLLTPGEIKQIIMETVDMKGFLLSKVKAKGIVNMDRAVYAASLTLSFSIDSAIAKAQTQVDDVAVEKELGIVNPFAVNPIPLTPLFK